jgi:S1-C subfamily serine protease
MPTTGARTRNIANGEEVKLRVRATVRRATSPSGTAVVGPEDSSLGLRVRTVPRVGVEVLAVEPQSRADRAGIRAGDLITVFGGQKAPAAAQIVRIFDGAARQTRLLVALSRGGEHHVVVLEKIATTP